ncbi:peptidyl-alpha-hydroxyglycine alpha-amidating lyase 2-like [Belonocnema kinseyi]|uniref:peptidyl-alpha-hydroxyglycine alpha-amidating lyase 2-like n=1 Tax=Belonocnema kinseyi TaxID=2817044 RepID=UPI00143DE67F|nr:peptidyl-alpha-hydroxyglycine alpha-amidating lyase 2-like [Belonocnema kinseyi]
MEYVDDNENERGPLPPPMDSIPHRHIPAGNLNPFSKEILSNSQEGLDPNIVWDSKWASNLHLGQVSAVSIDPEGNVAIFHRGSRVWDGGSFDRDNKFNVVNNNGPIKQNTIILLDKAGNAILHWGKNMFYMPHGLTIDHLGNYWITDVAMHQVFKFEAADIERNKEALMSDSSFDINVGGFNTNEDLFKNSILKPRLILGKAFVPGNDEDTFCKPTAVAVMKNGDFFVSDGYCNSRIIKFNAKGEWILTWGRSPNLQDSAILNPPPNSFAIPHALALAEDLGYIFVADREHGRVLCFFAGNGTFHKEYKDQAIGKAIYGVAYAKEKLFLVNGPDGFNSPMRGFILDINTDQILSQFAPKGGMARPHDIAVTADGREIFVVELDSNRVSRFIQGRNNPSKPPVSDLKLSGNSAPDYKTAPLPIDINKPSDKSSSSFLGFSLVIFIVVLIVICLILAAVVTRCRKRGCLLTSRRRMEWDSEKKQNLKLSSLLENKTGRKFKFFDKRPNKRDFSKLNTEPETSEDEQHPENSLTKII